MEDTVFKAYVVEEKDGHFTGGVKERRVEDLPERYWSISLH